MASVIGTFKRSFCFLTYCNLLVHAWPCHLWQPAPSCGSPTRSHRPQLQRAFNLPPLATHGFPGSSLGRQLCRESQMHLRAGGQLEREPHQLVQPSAAALAGSTLAGQAGCLVPDCRRPQGSSMPGPAQNPGSLETLMWSRLHQYKLSVWPEWSAPGRCPFGEEIDRLELRQRSKVTGWGSGASEPSAVPTDSPRIPSSVWCPRPQTQGHERPFPLSSDLSD